MKILNAVILPPYFFSCVFFTFVLSLRQKDKAIAVEKKNLSYIVLKIPYIFHACSDGTRQLNCAYFLFRIFFIYVGSSWNL